MAQSGIHMQMSADKTVGQLWGAGWLSWEKSGRDTRGHCQLRGTQLGVGAQTAWEAARETFQAAAQAHCSVVC